MMERPGDNSYLGEIQFHLQCTFVTLSFSQLWASSQKSIVSVIMILSSFFFGFV